MSNELATEISTLSDEQLQELIPNLSDDEFNMIESALSKSTKQAPDALDVSRFTSRPADFTINMLKGAGKELKTLGQTIGTAMLSINDPEVRSEVGLTLLETFKPPGYRKRQEKLINSIIDATPGLAKELIKSTGESFGIDETGFSTDTTLKKLEKKPIETVLDLSVLGGILRKVGIKATEKATGSLSKKLMKEKKLAKKILSKDELISRESKFLDKLNVDTPVQDLIKNADEIKNVPVKSLDNPLYAREIGKRFQKKLRALENAEKNSLNRELEKIKDIQVDNKEILGRIQSTFDENDLIRTKTKKKRLSKMLDEDINKASVRRTIEQLEAGETFTIKKIKDKIKILDDKINYNTLRSDHEGMMLMRRELRSVLGEVAEANNTAYNDLASRIHQRLRSIEKSSKKIQETGGGERFGRNFVSTEDEIKELISILDQSKAKVAPSMIADIKKLDGWHRWNRFFNQNERIPFIPSFISRGGIPLPTGGFVDRPRKALAKFRMKTGSIFPGVKTAQAIVRRTPAAVKTSNVAQEVKND